MKKIKTESLEIFKSLLRNERPAIPIRQDHELFLLAWCREHAITGLLHKHKDTYFSKDFSQFISSLYKENVQKNMIFLSEYEQISKSCSDSRLSPPVALKGLALLNRIYSLGERSLTDMDIYVSPEEITEFSRIIRLLGYSPVPEKKWKANSHKFIFTKKVLNLDVTLEIHTQLFYNQPRDFDVTTAQFGSITHLDESLELVYMSAHLVHQHTFLKLFWLVDMHLLSLKKPQTWNPTLWKMAQTLKVSTSLNAVAYALNNLFSHNIEVKNKFLPIKYFINWNTLILLNESRGRYLYLKHTSKDSLRETLSYDINWLRFRVEKILWKNNKRNEADL